MKRNESTPDRVLRFVGAVVAVAVAGVLGFTSVWGIVLIVVAVVLAVTAVTGFCLLYRLLGVSTHHEPPVTAG